MADLTIQLGSGRLTTAEILYRMPDLPKLLQSYIWQDYDMGPDYPKLRGFLEFWVREIEGPLHSVYVMRSELITPGAWRHCTHYLPLH